MVKALLQTGLAAGFGDFYSVLIGQVVHGHRTVGMESCQGARLERSAKGVEVKDGWALFRCPVADV